MKAGILGGTFNPVHIGHMEMAREALHQLHLDQVWIMPCGTPPHKDGEQIAGRIQRFFMCELMCREDEGILVSYEEYPLLEPNYSYQTFERLKQDHPDDIFYFLMGQDSLLYFDTWKEPKRILSCCRIGVFLRPDANDIKESIQICEEKIKDLKDSIGGEYDLIPFAPANISSTAIREKIRSSSDKAGLKKELECFVGESVSDYLIRTGLYQDSMMYDYAEIEKDLKSKLKKSRYRHTMGVCYTACALGMRYGLDVEKCRVAGLLHDCAKYMTNQEMLDYLKAHQIAITQAQEKAPQLLHATVGSIMAKELYHIEDEDVLHAILVHTTGCPNMNAYDEVIFIADYIEPNRDRARRLTEIRQLAYSDPDVCTLMILEDTIAYLKEKAQPMDQATVETYQYYKEKLGKTTFQ